MQLVKNLWVQAQMKMQLWRQSETHSHTSEVRPSTRGKTVQGMQCESRLPLLLQTWHTPSSSLYWPKLRSDLHTSHQFGTEWNLNLLTSIPVFYHPMWPSVPPRGFHKWTRIQMKGQIEFRQKSESVFSMPAGIAFGITKKLRHN